MSTEVTCDHNERVFMVGAFPPPVHGMATVNEAVRKSFQGIDVKPIVIDISAASLDRSFKVRLGRMLKVVRGLLRFLFVRKARAESLYMSVSGGLGQVYEIMFLIIGRFHRMRIHLHHHSFGYLCRTRSITSVLTAIAGPQSLHVALSPNMTMHLRMKYKSVRRAIPISNVVFLVDSGARQRNPRKRLNTVGFLSNIAREKGIFEFLDLISTFQDNELRLEARIAGPFQDDSVERRVRQRVSELPSTDYVGPVYGQKKKDFLEKIDVLIFPSQNEAEPLTIFEAMQNAVPVVTYGHGCIPEIISRECGLVINPDEPFVPLGLALLKHWRDNPDAYYEASSSAVRRYNCILEQNLSRWQRLLVEIVESGRQSQHGVQDASERSLSRT